MATPSKPDPWNGRNPEDDPDFQSKVPHRVKPWSKPDINRAFAAIVLELQPPQSTAVERTSPAVVTNRSERVNLAALDEPLLIDLRRGLTSNELVSLCQMCITGLAAAPRRRLCHLCLRIDRQLGHEFGGKRFLPTTRLPADSEQCATIKRLVKRAPEHERYGRARATEQWLWQQMDETFQANLRLMILLQELDEEGVITYERFAHTYPPSQSRSLDAYLSYARLHMPWSIPKIHALIEEIETGLR